MDQLAKDLLNDKAKPPGSLGTLENWAIKLIKLQESNKPRIDQAFLYLFTADHGITKTRPEVSAYPRALTRAVFNAVASGIAASSVLCKANDCSMVLVDVGIDDAILIRPCLSDKKRVLDCTIGPSNCMLSQPALTEEHLSEAGDTAKFLMEWLTEVHINTEENKNPVICLGEIGIGNTTSAAAILAAMTGRSAEEVCGRGTGIDDAGLQAKIEVVKEALKQHADLIKTGPKGVLQAVGGTEIAVMVAMCREAAEARIPVIVDGFVSCAAALLALNIDPISPNRPVKDCLFFSHCSDEKAASLMLEACGATGENRPPLNMGMRLGEGTGAVLALPLLRSAAAIASDMGTLEDALKL